MNRAGFTLRLGAENDAFATAREIRELNQSWTGFQNIAADAGLEPGEPSPSQSLGSLWWRYVPLVDGFIDIQYSTNAGISEVNVFVGNSLRSLIMAPLAEVRAGIWRARLTGGVPHYVRILGKPESGALWSMLLRFNAPEVNDQFAAAIALRENSGVMEGSTQLATVEAGEPLVPSGAPQSIWWSWTPVNPDD